MNRYLYSALLYLLTPVQFLRLWLRGRRSPGYRQRWNERLAFFPTLDEKPRIWLHAVSVGETIAAKPLVEKLLAEIPGHHLLITSTTPTGSEQVRRLFGDRVEHCYFPYDLPGAVKRFLHKTQPSLLIVMETELWPNCFFQCDKQGIPVIIANARLSPRSITGYQRFRRFTRSVLSNTRMIAAQSEADARHFISLGADPARVTHCGNIKFDITVDARMVQAGKMLREGIGADRPVWIAASTHAGEDEIMLVAHQKIREQLPGALLTLVPRHPERFDAVAALCQRSGLTVARRSKGEKPLEKTDVYLGDTMGELITLYAATDIAFVGGSLNDTGGHNPLEPAAIGLPVLTGPTIHNFRDIYQRLENADGSRLVHDADELASALLDAFNNPKSRIERGVAAKALIEKNSGAVDCIVAIVTEHVQ